MQKTLFILLFLVLSQTVNGQWTTNLAVNTPVCIAGKNQDNSHSVADTKGGVVMAWDDNRNSTTTGKDIYAQRITQGGIVKWANNGIAVCSNTATQSSSTMIDAGNGSTIIAWEDNRAGNFDIYAQKIDSSGNILWATDGIVVCNRANNQKNPKIVGDNVGGAIIVWEDSVSFYNDIYAQKINASGAPVWTSGGVPICAASNTQINPRIETDNSAGAYITWQDKRNNIDYDIYAQRILSAGTAAWTVNGVVVCNAINTQSNPRIEPDGSGGTIIGWVDKRNGTDNNIYAQRLNTAGVVQWTGNGIVACNAVNNQSALDMKYLGATGIILSWKDERVNANAIYAQIVSLTGVSILTANGILLSNSIKASNPNVINDGIGGAIIAWQDSVAQDWNIKAQKINSLGIILWASGGITVSSAIDDQGSVSQVSDNSGGALFVWEDHRNGTNDDIYANRILSNGVAANVKQMAEVRYTESVCYPNPVKNGSVIRIENATKEAWTITIVDAYGNMVETNHIENGNFYFLNSGKYSAGVYFYIVNLDRAGGYSKGTFVSIN